MNGKESPDATRLHFVDDFIQGHDSKDIVVALSEIFIIAAVSAALHLDLEDFPPAIYQQIRRSIGARAVVNRPSICHQGTHNAPFSKSTFAALRDFHIKLEPFGGFRRKRRGPESFFSGPFTYRFTFLTEMPLAPCFDTGVGTVGVATWEFFKTSESELSSGFCVSRGLGSLGFSDAVMLFPWPLSAGGASKTPRFGFIVVAYRLQDDGGRGCYVLASDLRRLFAGILW
jgi:hypothetical protein